MSDGRVLHAESADHVHVLRYEGDLRYPLATSVERFMNELFATGIIAGLVIDLTETHTIDSTHLGQIARLAKRVQDQFHGRATIVSPRETITEVLVSMGLDEVFDVVGKPLDGEPGEPIPVQPGSPPATLRSMLEAHRTLIELHEKNHAQFRDVVAMLELEVASLPADLN